MVISYIEVVPTPKTKVQIAGTWTDWKPVDMKFNKKYYYLEIEVDGGSFFYKFIVDDKWVSETKRFKADNDGNHFVDMHL